MLVSRQTSRLSKSITNRRMRALVVQLGCMPCEQHDIPTSHPGVQKDARSAERFPEVWRDRPSVYLQLAATPEYRSLNCL